ncbi:unnamed protein product [Brassica oleracea]
MVSQSNAAGSSGRRRRPNTPKAKPVSRSKKTKRYPVSDSDDNTTPSSMDSTAPTSPPVDAVDVGSSTKFLRRLFAPGFFLTQLRLNIYSKANVIASVASVLKGSSAMDRLLCSQFSKLFRLPVARCPNSTKLIGSLLRRQLITIRKYELWFTFDSETEINEPGSMWKQLFDTTRWWTGFCVVLVKHSSSPLTLQLLAFEAVPQLLARIPDADNTYDFLDNPLCCGNTVVILNTNDIVAVEGELDVIVDFSLVPEAERHFWLDEVEDPKVTRLVDHIRFGHTFRTEDFEGGDRSFGKDNAIPEGKPQDQFEKTLCDHFGVPLPNIHNKGKRKRPNRKSRKINSTVPKPGPEMHSYPLRSAEGLEGAIGNTQPGFSRETRENNENSTLLTPQFDQNATDQKPHTPNAIPDESQTPNPLTTLTIYRGLLFARPQSYVSPAKKDDTYIGEKAVDVTWDEANPRAYSAVKEVPAGERPSSDPNPESAPDFASTRSEDNVGPVSTNLSGQKTQEPVIEGGVPDSMVVQNPTSPVEEDENYESWKENISFDSQLQGKRPRAVEDMPSSETDEDENYVESSGKRVPKKSQKIRGVYTPDARLKGLFMSEKKVEYRPLPKTNRAIFKKFSDILSENVEQ